MIALRNELLESSPELDAPDLPPSPGGASRVLYAASYYVSYSVSLPALMIANLVPRNSAVRRGMHHGACDAAEAHQRFQVKASTTVEATRDKVGGAYAHVATRVAQRVEAVQDAVAERKYRRRIAMTF